jgi:hypothetical protein
MLLPCPANEVKIVQMYLFNLTLPPMPVINNSTTKIPNITAASSAPPTSKFLGNISTPWIGPGNSTSGPNATLWGTSKTVTLYSNDYGGSAWTQDSVPTPSCLAAPYTDTAVNHDLLLDTITNQTCTYLSSTAVTDTSVNIGVSPQNPYIPMNYQLNNTGTTLWVSVSLMQHPECTGEEVLFPDCVRFFTSIVNGCSGNVLEDKYSGSLVNHCTIFDIVTVPGTGDVAATPPKGTAAKTGEWYGY